MSVEQTGFELSISSFRSDRSTSCATDLGQTSQRFELVGVHRLKRDEKIGGMLSDKTTTIQSQTIPNEYFLFQLLKVSQRQMDEGDYVEQNLTKTSVTQQRSRYTMQNIVYRNFGEQKIELHGKEVEYGIQNLMENRKQRYTVEKQNLVYRISWRKESRVTQQRNREKIIAHREKENIQCEENNI